MNGPWLIVEDGFDPALANRYETLFTVGNGYLGTRGTLDEGHQGALPGTFLRGVFDHHDSAVIDLVNAPDWVSLAVTVNGVRLDVTSAQVLEHRRTLDLSTGTLSRETVFADAEGRRTRVSSQRFASVADQHLCCLQVQVTPEDHDAAVTVHSGVDGTGYNLDRPPIYTDPTPADPHMTWEKWARSKHLDEVARDASPDGLYLEMRTIDTGITVGYAGVSTPSPAAAGTATQRFRHVEQEFRSEVAANRTLTVDKLVTIYTSRDVAADSVRAACVAELRRHRDSGFAAAAKRNRDAWQARWDAADVRVEGDDEATLAVRFNLYHLMIAANECDPRANIGAKSLSGEFYRGHTFWDTEIFLLPFFIYTHPETARALLEYRYHTMAGAKANARDGGFRGARYAWESADTGVETTPKWTVDGAHRIWMGEQEVHVTAAVAHGLLSYLVATGDVAMMAEFGAEILFETSRFWMSRLEPTAGGEFGLTTVVGPDEFHEHVDNNAYTNYLVRWHLLQAAKAYDDLAAGYPDELAALAARIGLTADEVREWRATADRVHLPPTTDAGVIEQFDGYFALGDLPVTVDENDMPRYPEGYHHYNLERTTLLKQADVVMLTYVLPDEFSDAVKRANYDFYEPRTLHKSSLSPAVHSIMGIEVGDPSRAVQYFRRAAFVDLIDNQGNTCDGMHIAAAGGTWQMMVCGFGGFRVRNGRLTFKPWLPPGWAAISFRLAWHGNRVAVRIEPATATFELHGPAGAEEQIVVNGLERTLRAEQPLVVDLRDGREPGR
jgi:kojibiose phosphorylase